VLWAWLVPGCCCCCFTVVAAATEPEPSHRRPTGLLQCCRRLASLASSLSLSVSQLSREGFQGSGYRSTCCCIASSRRHRITPLTRARTRKAGTGLGFRVLGFLGLRVGDGRRTRQRRGEIAGGSGWEPRKEPPFCVMFFIFLLFFFLYFAIILIILI